MRDEKPKARARLLKPFLRNIGIFGAFCGGNGTVLLLMKF
jgi:tRNA nucleotidyltransferase (CCA-adding enzyme)